MDADDDSLLAVYNAELIALSGEAMLPKHIHFPDATAKAVSPICGSEITVQLKLDGDRVADFGFEVEACALTKTVVAVMNKAIIGKTRADVARAGTELEAMLNGETVFPSGDWAKLQILEPVKDYKARHNSILLPFEAVEKAFLKE
ncbi:MAG TPA: iron-sulfur cluster assembly scaffold protein [Patescibacteria group bacterium]|nr:iron-sulfur cluster assembly scaffold protein [Patescibacteria group bacterium]